MKTDINDILNRLLAYSFDNLLLDITDAQYTLNRLAVACGFNSPALDEDADYGDATLDALLGELSAAVPTVDKTAVLEVLFPMPRTVNYYFDGKLDRDANKAFDFLFDLYAKGGFVANGDALLSNGYVLYAAKQTPVQPLSLTAGELLDYTPRAYANRIATLKNPDILSEDIVAREVAFAGKYGGTIAVRMGDATDYMTCKTSALAAAKVKTQLSTGAVKISLLDYPVPALAFNGIAKNAVTREATRVVKAATDAGLPCVVAATDKDGVTVYVVFAKESETSEYLTGSDALSACGVFKTKDCSALLPVLEKGTALSTDLAEFKIVYDKIGGVKYGKDAANKLADALTAMILPALKAAASATEEQASALAAKPE